MPYGKRSIKNLSQKRCFQGISGMLKHKPAGNGLKFISQNWNNYNLQKRSWLILKHMKIKYIPILQPNFFIFIYRKISLALSSFCWSLHPILCGKFIVNKKYYLISAATMSTNWIFKKRERENFIKWMTDSCRHW